MNATNKTDNTYFQAEKWLDIKRSIEDIVVIVSATRSHLRGVRFRARDSTELTTASTSKYAIPSQIPRFLSLHCIKPLSG
jgi:hypothetical protein